MTPKKNTPNKSHKRKSPTPLPQVEGVPSDWLTVGEVAALLRTSEMSVRRAMLAGELRSADLIGGRKTTSTWLREYVEERIEPGNRITFDPTEAKNRHSSPKPGAA